MLLSYAEAVEKTGSDWRILGYGLDEPWEERSNTKQQIFIDNSRERLFSFLKERFVDEVKQGLQSIIGKPMAVEIDENDDGILLMMR